MDEHSYMIGYREGWNDARSFMTGYGSPPQPFIGEIGPAPSMTQAPIESPKKKRKPSAYNKRLGREIKALRKRHMLKSGKWRKGWNQRKMMKQAHKNAKR